MRDSPDPANSVVVAAFLRQYLEDQRTGRVRSLAEYQRLFPGHADDIARELAALEEVSLGDSDALATDECGEREAFDRIGESVGATSPDRIGPYRIIETVGEGGMGVVYLAEQTEPIQRRVALKLVKLGMDTREVLARFDSERQALALMAHRHIASVHDAGATDRGRPFFVMEYVAGVPMTRFCDERRLPTRARLDLFLQVCDAVQHAHHKGIIHRDIKPTNVLVFEEDGAAIAKIIDFGIAKSTGARLTEKTLHTQSGQLVGTPSYMSPEQASGDTDIDARTDIYSLGVLLYELLTGYLPFDPATLLGGGYASIERTIREVDPPTPSSRLSRLREGSAVVAAHRRATVKALASDLRGDLDAIVMRAMDKDRDRRYASASELAADVTRFLTDTPILARPASTAYRLRKLAKRHRFGLTVAIVVAALIVWGGLASLSLVLQQYEDLAEARQLTTEGRESVREHERLVAAIRDRESFFEERRGRLDGTRLPVWELRDVVAGHRQLLDDAARIPVLYGATRGDLVVALSKSSRGSVVNSAADKLLEELEESRREFFGTTHAARMTAPYFDTLNAATEPRTLTIRSDPPGATAYGFRYREHEGRFVPLPPGGEPFLRVSRSGTSPFRKGDRIEAIDGKSVRSRTELVAHVRSAPPGAAFRVTVRRGDATETFAWRPTPEPAPNDAPEFPLLRRVLGVEFEAYPLLFSAAARLGETGPDGLEARLAGGSYLIVLREEGYADTRYPVAICDADETIDVRLLRSEEIPEGFVYVPAGPVALGRDEAVDKSLPYGSKIVDGFFMSRFEVTFGEYAEFLSRRELADRIDKDGKIDKVQYLPRVRLKQIARGDDGVWTPCEGYERLPVHEVPWSVAREYARWRGARLPSDLEWERAARGVDRRYYAWGNTPIWTFCQSHFGAPVANWIDPVDVCPFDASVFGVRGMTGAVAEWTRDETEPGLISIRGGSYKTFTGYYYRIANRLGRPPGGHFDTGIRLVMPLPKR